MFARSALLIALLAVTGCTRPSAPNLQAAAPPAIDTRMSLVDERKDEVLRQLAVCESGAHGDAAVPVIGGRLQLGTWQSICLVDINVDNPDREVRLSFIAG